MDDFFEQEIYPSYSLSLVSLVFTTYQPFSILRKGLNIFDKDITNKSFSEQFKKSEAL